MKQRRVAVIGGGVSGLVAARHLSDPVWGCDFLLFEQTGALGGTWVYSDRIGKDEHGLPVHSSMYKNLRTNLPKEAMMFPDFPHSKQNVSYMTAKDILQYLNDYADHFQIRPYVKFYHHVKRVSPSANGWMIDVLDLRTMKNMSYTFDAVIVCNGHNSRPRYPSIKGIQYFSGQILHSHDYRDPKQFQGARVLLIGAGPSGMDLALDLSKVASKVILSHHTSYADNVGFPKTVLLKPDVQHLDEDGNVIYKDGTMDDVDVIIYCTGYLYTFPFLTEDCGISVQDNFVTPLYKSIININHPTMAMLAIIKHTPTFYVVDLQVRFFLYALVHPERLPSKEEMFRELEEEIQMKKEKGRKQRDFHLVGEDSEDYINSLAKFLGVESIPPILLKIYFHGFERIFSDFKNFRNNYYKILDKDDFTVVDLREISAKPMHTICSSTIPQLVSERKI